MKPLSTTPYRTLLLTALLACGSVATFAADWPMWRADAARTGNSTEQLPEELHLQWTLTLPPPQPAWPSNQDKLQFDRLYEPIIVGDTLIVPSMLSDRVTAYDLASGEERWRFYAGGPVRFAPAAWGESVYFVSDDGYLYCVSVADGSLRWRFRGGPEDRYILGNDRLVSLWPARGGPVVHDGTVYFGASIWPFMGIFIHALDAESGAVIWTNSGNGTDYLTQQHNSPAFSGVSPQGYMAVRGDRLVISGGRTIPAVYDRHTGEFLHFNVASRKMGSKGGGGYEVVVGENFYLNRGSMYRLDNGKFVVAMDALIVSPNAIIGKDKEGVAAYRPRWEEKVTKDRKGKETKSIVVKKIWTTPVDEALDEVFIKSGTRLYATGKNGDIVALELPQLDREAGVSWRTSIPDKPLNMISGGGRLVVTTDRGRIYCFGAEDRDLEIPPLETEVSIIPRESIWSYFDRGAAPEGSWTSKAYDDSKWAKGPAQLGYGDGDEATEVSFGENEKQKHPTTYFRHRFEVPAGVEVKSVELRALVDDGAVFYFDGAAIGRLRLPEKDVKYSTFAEKDSGDEKKFESVPLDAALLTPGVHCIAVEVHQSKAASSDLSFALELKAKAVLPASKPAKPPKDEWSLAAGRIIRQSGRREGYAVVLGLDSPRLAEELALQSRLHVVVIDSDAEAIAALRRRLDELGLYGSRVAAIVHDPRTVQLPAYMADLIVLRRSESMGVFEDVEALRRLYETLRPYSGALVVPSSRTQHNILTQLVGKAALAGATEERAGRLSILRRTRPADGAADWTHQYGSAANTVASDDSLVRLPLGVLWFGGPSNAPILPRHGHGPAPQVVGGRVFIEGRDILRAVDMYTGRLLWERTLKDVGKNYDYTSHEPGANALGSNYVSLADGVYIVHADKCLRLDPATGETMLTLALPAEQPDDFDFEIPPRWGYLGAWNNVLVAGAKPTDFNSPDFESGDFSGLKDDPLKKAVARVRGLIDFTPIPMDGDEKKQEVQRKYVFENMNKLLREADMVAKIPLRTRYRVDGEKLEKELADYLGDEPEKRSSRQKALVLKRKLLHLYYGGAKYEEKPAGKFDSLRGVGSKSLVAFDRHTGRTLWDHEARYQMRHNAIALGGGSVFYVDRLSDERASFLKRRGLPVDEEATVGAIDIRSGDVVWTKKERVFGTWLGYSEEHDVLIQAGSKFRDRSNDEVGKGIVAYRGATGDVIWQSDDEYGGPCVILGDQLFTQGDKDKPGFMIGLLTGKRTQRPHPLTGRDVAWGYTRNYGCNTAIGSPNLLTFRSAAAGFYDLLNDGGTGNLGGFRSGCTSNLIPAGGILNAPDYTRTCTCSYQNQASLALIHMPDVEMWTFNAYPKDAHTIERVGLNFGAPGDRRGPDGTLWIDYPSVGGTSPDISVEVLGEKPRYSRHHSSRLRTRELSWVGASAIETEGEIAIKVNSPDELIVPDELARGPAIVAKRASVWLDVPGGAVPKTGQPNERSLRKANVAGKLEASLPGHESLAVASVTVEMWGRADSDFDFVDARVSDEKKKHGFVVDNRELRARYYVRNEAGDGAENVVEIKSKEKIPDNKWVHIAFTYDDGTGVGTLWLNGKDVGRHDGPDRRPLWWAKSAPSYAIGKDAEKSGCAIDELRISSVALAPNEFLLSSDPVAEGVGGADATVGYWRMTPEPKSEAKYTVRLVFAEIADVAVGERVFDVWIQGEKRLEEFDVTAESGGTWRTVVREWTGIGVDDYLRIRLAASGSGELLPLLSGVQVTR